MKRKFKGYSMAMLEYRLKRDIASVKNYEALLKLSLKEVVDVEIEISRRRDTKVKKGKN